MPMFQVTVVPRGTGAHGDEPKTLMIDAPTPDEARLKVASRGLKAIAIKRWQDRAHICAAVAVPSQLPPPAYVRPETARTTAGEPKASRPAPWRGSEEFSAAAALAARYLCWLGVVLTVYGGICAYGAMGIPGLVGKNVFWADRWIRGLAIWLAFLAPALVCFFLAVKALSGAAWSLIAGIVVSALASSGMLVIVLLCLFGLPQSLTPLLIAFIPLVLAVASVVYAAKALRAKACDPRRQPAGFDVTLPPAAAG